MIHISDELEIPETEVAFVTSRSSGPGGQNVNKVNTRVTLLFDLEASTALSPQQRELLRRRLPGRINRQGILRVVSQRHRTQWANREAVLERFTALLREALTESPQRIAVEVPQSIHERRLEEKRRRGRLKRERAADHTFDE